MMQRYKQPHFDVHPDGEWIRYEDHVEAMKRIAGDGVAQGLTVELIREIGMAYDPNVRNFVMNGLERARSILSQSAPRADHSGGSAEMVVIPQGWKLVPIHPTEEMEEAIEEALRDEGFASPEVGETDKRFIYHSALDAAPAFEKAVNAAPSASAQPAYLHNGARAKVSFRDDLGCYIAGLPDDMNGRWVAFVEAEDGKHLRAAPSASAQQAEPANPYAAQGSLEEAWHRGFNGQRGLAASGSNYDNVWHEGAAARKAYDAGRAAPAPSASPADQVDARIGEMVCGDVESTLDGYEVGDYELIYGKELDEINVNHPGKVFAIYIDRAAMSATPPAAENGEHA